MNFFSLDLIIILIYLIAVALIGSLSGGKQKSTKDYFMGGENVPWWAVSFSIVAAETSSLTFISIPGLAYLTNLNFLQLTFGYVIARILVAFLFLPSYQKGELSTAYTYLEKRFGILTRRYASIVFLFTRVAADGVRLFSTAIPLALIFKSTLYFSNWSNFQIYALAICVITIISFIYTFTGGVKGVIWADALQMFIYVGGAVLAIIILTGDPNNVLDIPKSKIQLFNFNIGTSIAEFFSKPYTFVASLIGGIFLSMASHGTDQLIVQRLLTTNSLKNSQKAIIMSGILVVIQFTLFLFVGLLLYSFFNGISINDPAAPFNKPDEIFPYFIIHYLPTGIKGFIIAGLFAAAMSTLAGSISSLSSSFMLDIYKPILKKSIDKIKELFISRALTVFWAIILMIVAFLFITLKQSVVEIALGIASVTYGGLLGTFLLGLFFKNVKQIPALIGFSCAILTMVLIIVIPQITKSGTMVHWTWYVAIGTTVTILIGNITNMIINRIISK